MLAPSRLPRTLPLLRRTLTSSSSARKTISPATATQSNPTRDPPAATSTSAAQPFSTPLTPSATSTPTPATDAHKKEARKPSSTPAGTILKGLNFHKNRTDPVALPDEDYPPWLWTLLEPSSGAAAEKKQSDPRLYAKSANIRRKAKKRLRAEAAGMSDAEANTMAIEERSTDLPGSSEEAIAARGELRQAMRRKRRADIKEKNFLITMG